MTYNVLFLPIKHNLNLLFVEVEPKKLAIYTTKKAPHEFNEKKEEDLTFYDEINIDSQKAFSMIEEIFTNLKPTHVLLPQKPFEYKTRNLLTKNLVIVTLIKLILETCAGLDFSIGKHFLNYITYIDTPDLSIFTEKSIHKIMSYLEQQEKINPIFFILLDTYIPKLSNIHLDLTKIIPDTVIDKINFVHNDILYFHPVLSNLFKRKHTDCKYFKLANTVKEIQFFYDYKNQPTIIEKSKASHEPSNILTLIETITTNKPKLQWNSDFVDIIDEPNFAWLLVYIFDKIYNILPKFSPINPHTFYMWYDRKLSKIEHITPSLAKIYSNYIQIVNNLKTLNQIEKEFIIISTHMEIQRLINIRELNIVFLNYLNEVITKRRNNKDFYKKIVSPLSKNKRFLNTLCISLTSLAKEDIIFVESFASSIEKTPIPRAILLFYPWIKETKIYKSIQSNVAKTKKECILFFKTYEVLLKYKINKEVMEALTNTKNTIEEKIEPRIAFTLIKEKIQSSILLEKSRIFTLTGYNNKLAYDKATYLNMFNVKTFWELIKKIMTIPIDYKTPNKARDFLLLGKELGKILTDEEFEVISDLISLHLNKHIIYINQKISEKDIDDVLNRQKNNVIYFALKKIAALEKEKELND